MICRASYASPVSGSIVLSDTNATHGSHYQSVCRLLPLMLQKGGPIAGFLALAFAATAVWGVTGGADIHTCTILCLTLCLVWNVSSRSSHFRSTPGLHGVTQTCLLCHVRAQSLSTCKCRRTKVNPFNLQHVGHVALQPCIENP